MDEGGRAIVCRAMECPCKSAEFILSGLISLNTAGRANSHKTKYLY
jgi:hypothetical protein